MPQEHNVCNKCSTEISALEKLQFHGLCVKCHACFIEQTNLSHPKNPSDTDRLKEAIREVVVEFFPDRAWRVGK